MSKPGWHERKHHADRIYKKRIKNLNPHNYNWWFTFNSNGDQYNIDWTSFILHTSYIYLKKTSTTKFDTRHKSKYSPNKGYNWRDSKTKSQTFGLREKVTLIQTGGEDYETITDVNEIAKEKGFVKKGDFLINLAAMPIIEKGMVNTLRVSEIE